MGRLEQCIYVTELQSYLMLLTMGVILISTVPSHQCPGRTGG